MTGLVTGPVVLTTGMLNIDDVGRTLLVAGEVTMLGTLLETNEVDAIPAVDEEVDNKVMLETGEVSTLETPLELADVETMPPVNVEDDPI